LDDPVTSLDLEWSAVIASLLVNEAIKRQVVVFTHNLPFVHYLKNYSNDLQVDVQMHWIKRGENDDQPGYVFANNSPALESSYKSTHIANEHYKEAKDLPPSDQEKELKQGFGALRTTYESFIIYTLLGGVVIRWDERISPGRLKDVVWDKDLFQKVIDKHESLSKYIEGHLHSDAFVPVKPTPELLMHEIQEFDKIKKQHKQLKNAVI
jgi:wobble nucleotide-excising tRNase